MKILWSPLWAGALGVMFSAVVLSGGLCSRSWSWWSFQLGLAAIFSLGAVFHGHRRWKRLQCLSKKFGLEGKRTVLLGRNSVGYVDEGENDEG